MTSNNNITHPSNPGLTLEEVNFPSRRYTCDGCKMDGTGIRYTCESCNYNLHPDCMYTSPEINIEGQNCIFHEKPPVRVRCKKPNCTKCRRCDACGKTIMGFVYHCQNKDWDFHPRCAKLKDTICIKDVTFRLEKHIPSSCARCKRKLLKGAVKDIPGWSYISNNDEYSFHVYCVMEMPMLFESSSSNNEVSTSSKRDNPNTSLALKGIELPLKAISKKNKNGTSSKLDKWLNITKIFLSTLCSILLGDPTTILASTMAHLITQTLFNVG